SVGSLIEARLRRRERPVTPETKRAAGDVRRRATVVERWAGVLANQGPDPPPKSRSRRPPVATPAPPLTPVAGRANGGVCRARCAFRRVARCAEFGANASRRSG